MADLTVDPNTIKFDDMPDGGHQAQLEFVLMAYDAGGKRLNYLGRSLAMKFTPEQFAQIAANGIRVRLALDLPAGQDSLRIAVEDLTAGRTGSLELPLDVAR